MNTCLWRGCDQPRRARGVCQRHHARTLRAGRRAAEGAPRAHVFEAIRQADHADRVLSTPVPDRLDDLSWLLECGEWPDTAARRCGWTRSSALTIARRHGRDDVADALTLEAVPA